MKPEFKLKNPLKNMLVTQRFGNPSPLYDGIIPNGKHNGLDMRAPDGTPVYATHDGRVIFAGYDGSGGLGVIIRTEEKFEYNEKYVYMKTLYWHLKKDSLLVTGGQQVKVGQQIAEADNTGYSTGSHLHFGLKPIVKGENDWTWINVEQDNGYVGAIDPEPYMKITDVFKEELKFGDVKDDVIILQAFFLRQGLIAPISEDEFGYYGNKTAKAVLTFQLKYCKLSWYEKYFLRGTKVGPKTLEALNRIYI